MMILADMCEERKIFFRGLFLFMFCYISLPGFCYDFFCDMPADISGFLTGFLKVNKILIIRPSEIGGSRHVIIYDGVKNRCL